jgi:hypothetical protein
MTKTSSIASQRRYQTPTFETGQQLKQMLAGKRVKGEQSRPMLAAGRSKAREAANLLAGFRAEPEHDVWRALSAIERRPSMKDADGKFKQKLDDPRAPFLLMNEMGRTTAEGIAMAKRNRRVFPKEWQRVREVLASLTKDVELLRSLMTWMPRDHERREMFVDLVEIAEQFVEWFDELAPPLQKGAPRAAEDDPARGFAGVVLATLKRKGFSTADLMELVNESASVWRPPPIGPSRLRELRTKRNLRDLLAALVREGLEGETEPG